MKAIVSIYTASILLALLLTASESAATTIGVNTSYQPSWSANAQVKLGWDFTNPEAPQNDSPIFGWNIPGAGNSIPTWSYSLSRYYSSYPAQWYIRVPNLSDNYISNEFWFCVVYDYSKNYTGPYGWFGNSIYSSIVGDPAASYSTVLNTYPEQYLDGFGTTVAAADSTYARFTQLVRLAPNLNGEYLYIGLPTWYVNGNWNRPTNIKEVYIMTRATHPPIETVTFAPDAGTYTGVVSVVMDCATPGVQIHYTTDGSTPTQLKPSVSNGGSVPVNQSLTLKARAYKTDMSPSPVKTAAYTLVVTAPYFTPPAGNYEEPFDVVVDCQTVNVTIHYTINGTVPTTADPTIAKGGSIRVDQNMYIYAKAWRTGWEASSPARGPVSNSYTLSVKTPTLIPNGGAFTNPVDVIVQCATPGAIMYYTTNGTEVVELSGSSAVSGDTIRVTGNIILSIQGFKPNWNPSTVKVAFFMAGATEVSLGQMVTSPFGADDPLHPPIVSNVAPIDAHSAVYLDYTNIVMFTSPGVVAIYWWQGTVYIPALFVVVEEPWGPLTQRKLYWNNPPDRGPIVELRNMTVKIYHNGNIPYRTNGPIDGFVWLDSSGNLNARGRLDDPGKGTGYLIFEYREGEEGPMIGVEVVEVLRNVDWKYSIVPIGSRLMPIETRAEPDFPHVAAGAPEMIYQHSLENSEMEGAIFATRQNTIGAAMEVFWTEKGLQDSVWPYEMHRYGAGWPPGAQRYIRGNNADALGTPVYIPKEYHPELMPAEFYYNSGNHGHMLQMENTHTFYSDGTGYSLLKYQSGPEDRIGSAWVDFQVIKSIIHTNAAEATIDLTPQEWHIGTEITNVNHEGPGTGYIHTNAFGNAYAGTRYLPGVYEYPEPYSQIFGVNTETLEVWWCSVTHSNLGKGIQWPSQVSRYNTVWPTSGYERIVIASQEGSGIIDPISNKNWLVYYQNDPTQPGFNPNDEHAMMRDGKVWALRDDLGSNITSEAFVLMPYRSPAHDLKWRMRLFKPYATDAPQYIFNYTGTAGKLIQAPMPLSSLPGTDQSMAVSGPAWKSRKNNFWARAAGDRNGPTNVTIRFWYPYEQSFYIPAWYKKATYRVTSVQEIPGVEWTRRYSYNVVALTNKFEPGDAIPFLDLRAGTAGMPIDVGYTIVWGNDYPELRVSETLVKPKFGLPSIWGQSSVEVIYQQSQALQGLNAPSVTLIDPTRNREFDPKDLGVNKWHWPPSDVRKALQDGKYFFPDLPPQLRDRVWYDPINEKLRFKGKFIEPAAGESYLLVNVITEREKVTLEAMSKDDYSGFPAAMKELVKAASSVMEFTNDHTTIIRDNPDGSQTTNVVPVGFDSLALTAGLSQGTGLVTVAFANSKYLSDQSEPISLEIFRVVPPLYRGELKVIESDNAFDEKLTLRHSGDFAGKPQRYEFEWRTLPPNPDGSAPNKVDNPYEQWTPYPMKPTSGEGSVDITIEGPGIFTLADNYFICRYRRPDGTGPTGTSWSEWTDAQLAEGWIKRVLNGINPFEQRFSRYSFNENEVNRLVSMIAQAGTRWVGAVPMNSKYADDFGLLEIYETVFKRGIDLSIEGIPPINYGPANDALLLVSGRIADLYMLLGNEAYADASDPTIAFGTDDRQYGSEASSLHCFMNQTATLLEEETKLMRGRDDSLLPSVRTFPFYNRLIWNFTRDITGGEVAYALNYNIQDASGEVDGAIDELDARVLYPQGHGDAWGHYLIAIKPYYRLLRSRYFDWVPRIEAVMVGGVAVNVDYMDERKFAKVAAAKARTGAEIINLERRSTYEENPEMPWQGYKDDDEERAWGYAEWGNRVGQGTYFDWLVGNAMLPPEDPDPTHFGIQKVDRQTVEELEEVATLFTKVQVEVDNADVGFNPLGLAKNVLPFDINPALVTHVSVQTHFDQIYSRAVLAMQNALTVFDHARNSTQLLRRQADTLNNFNTTVINQEASYNNRLIEVFGYPYDDDLGPPFGSYESEYNGPDLLHWMYVERVDFPGTFMPVYDVPVTLTWYEVEADLESGNNGKLISTNETIVTFHISENMGLVKPSVWQGKRRAQGELQLAYSDILQLQLKFKKAAAQYDQLIWEIDGDALVIKQVIQRKATTRELKETYNTFVKIADAEIAYIKTIRAIIEIGKGYLSDIESMTSKSVPQILGVIAGVAAGTIMDPSPMLKGPAKTVEMVAKAVLNAVLKSIDIAEMWIDFSKNYKAMNLETALNDIADKFDIYDMATALQAKSRRERELRIELYTLEETVIEAVERYKAALAKGERILQERTSFRMQTAASIQNYRYNDMAFRIFRNDALQKYRAQFDLAARYVYLAAKAYDYETSLAENDPRGAGLTYLSKVVRQRSPGIMQGGVPQTGPATGDPGLADIMAQMNANWSLVLKNQLGFNNPDTETSRFSLRSELFRSLPETNTVAGILANLNNTTGQHWRTVLQSCIVTNIFALPEFERYCIPFTPHKSSEPGIVIEFSTTIDAGTNFFGWPLGGGDSAYDSTHFATKIRSAGIWFSNYDSLGLSQTPRVYLFPVGNDILRSPGTDGNKRSWQVMDQMIPVPFPITYSDLADPGWIPINASSAGQYADIRRYSAMRAYHDRGMFVPEECVSSSRLIGRSVWNTRWMMVIPAASLHNDRAFALERFLDGVTDIKIFFQTYSYSGN